MRFIGDTHGDYHRYRSIALEAEQSIQVGDFGMGFGMKLDKTPNHRFIRGNHDNPELCRISPNWIPDGNIEGRMFFLGGGYSVDWHTRCEGVDWWRDEELTIGELNDLIDIYEASTCDIVVTHECPSVIAEEVFQNRRRLRIENPSRTSQALSALMHIRAPKIWIFGHWHIPVDEVIGNTRFICLSECQHIDLEI